MKRMKKWFSIFLVIVFTMTLVPTTAFAANSYTINGVTVTKDTAKTVNNCAKYASEIQTAIWGKITGATSFDTSFNMLRNKSAEERLITAENVEKYIKAAPLGSRIRICASSDTKSNDRDNNRKGHTMILVAKNDQAGTFTTLEGNYTDSKTGKKKAVEKIYSYDEFVSTWATDRKNYQYFYYISDLTGTKYAKEKVAESKGPSTLNFTLPSKSYPEGVLQQGKSFTLKGTIKSNYPITYVKGAILDSAGVPVQTKEILNGKSKNISIQSSILNKQLKFGTLPAGSYKMYYFAKDSSGKTMELFKDFTVAGKNTPVTAKKYTITLNAQGGTVSKKSIQVEEGKPYGNLPSATKSGYTFKGWFANAAGTGNALTAGTVIPAKNHTIYAKWEKVQTPAPTPVPTPTTNCNGNHTKGAFVRTEKEHPHMDIYKCKVCGKQFESGSTKCISSCQICNPVKDCNGRHTKGAFVRTEKVHPHKNVYVCKVCGKEYEDGSTKYISSCQTCNPVKQLIKAPAAKVIMNTGATLKNSVKSDDVRRLQMNLNTLGFNCGSADGAYGNNTKKAVIGFQNDQGLTADGIAGRNTLTRMVDIAVTVQTQLYQLGYYTGNIDGVMGSGTQTALKKFQKENGFTQNGLATANVRNALAKAVR